MKFLVTKASDDYWYEIVECDTIDEMFKHTHNKGYVVQKNYYTTKEDFEFWDGFRKEDISTAMACKYHITIYDSYLD